MMVICFFTCFVPCISKKVRTENTSRKFNVVFLRKKPLAREYDHLLLLFVSQSHTRRCSSLINVRNKPEKNITCKHHSFTIFIKLSRYEPKLHCTNL